MARKKTIYWGIAMGPSGPFGYSAAVFMKAVGRQGDWKQVTIDG